MTESSVRLENELDASAVFTLDENGSMVLAGPNLYAERRPRWRTEVIRMPLLFAPPVIASVLPMTLLWLLRIRRARPSGFWGLKLALLLCPLTMAVPFLALVGTPTRQWGAMNAGTIVVYVGTLLIPAAAALALVMTVWAWRGGASRWLLAYGTLVTIAMAGVSRLLREQRALGTADVELLASVPDLPRWVEARGMLLSGRGAVVETGLLDPPTVVASPAVMLAVVLRWDQPETLTRALRQVPREFSIVGPADAEEAVSRATAQPAS